MGVPRDLAEWLTSVFARHLFSVPDDLLPDFVEIVKFLTRQMQELSPLVRIVLVDLHFSHAFLSWISTWSLLGGLTCIFIFGRCSVCLGRDGSMNELKDKGSTRNDTRSSWQEVTSDNVLESHQLARVVRKRDNPPLGRTTFHYFANR